MTALPDLVGTKTAAELLPVRLNFLAGQSFPVTSWQSGSVPLTLLNASAASDADTSVTIQSIAAGSFIAAFLPGWAGPVPPSGWLDLAAASNYTLERIPGVVTQGSAVLTDVGGGGPYTIVANQLSAKSTNGLVYTNTTGGVLPKSGTLTLTWQGANVGSAYNVPNGAITSLQTPLPGVTIANPDPGTGTWISQLGTDPETNGALATRCTQKWGDPGSGAATLARFAYWAVTSTPTVTRVNVREDQLTGNVTIYCAGSTGASSPADVASVNAYIQPKRPLCVTVNVFAGTTFVLPLEGTVTVSASLLASAKVAFANAMAAYASSLPLGGTVLLAKLIDLAMNVGGVQNVVFTSPQTDIPFLSSQVVSLDLSGIVFQGV